MTLDEKLNARLEARGSALRIVEAGNGWRIAGADMTARTPQDAVSELLSELRLINADMAFELCWECPSCR